MSIKCADFEKFFDRDIKAITYRYGGNAKTIFESKQDETISDGRPKRDVRRRRSRLYFFKKNVFLRIGLREDRTFGIFKEVAVGVNVVKLDKLVDNVVHIKLQTLSRKNVAAEC